MYEQFILNLTGANGWMPHGFCIQWTPSILWSYVVSDALTALSYYAIPLQLIYIAWRRKDLKFRRIYLMFGAFILACGTSHLLSIALIWHPFYWLDAIIKVITAGLSMATAIYLITLIPLALQKNTSVELENKLLHSLVKQSATELKNLNARFNATFENAPIGIINLSPEGDFLEINQRFSEFINYRKGDLIALTFKDIMPKADYGSVSGKIAECLTGEISEFTVENQYRCQDGKQFWGSTSIKLMRYKDGSPNYFMAIIEDISQRKIAETILQERDKLNFILNNTPVLIGYWDNQLKNLFSNPAYTRWFDKTPEQIKGQHIRQVLGKQLYSENLPHINAVLQGEPQKFLRHILNQQTDEIIYTQLSYLPHIVKQEVQGFYVLGVDITDQERLNDANYYNLTLLKNLTQGVILTDINKKISYINPAFEKVSGYSNEDLLGKSCTIMQGEKTDPEEILLILEALSSLQNYQGELINYRKDGSAFWVELVITPVYDRHNNFIQFIGFHRNISERKQIERELREAKDKAEHLMQAKSNFLANMSHEIRTPMTAIIGFSELALTKASSPEITSYLYKINSASTNLLGILNDILDLSKLEAGSIAIYPAPFSIDNLRDNLYQLFIDSAEKKGLDFTIMVGADVPRSLVGDKLRLEQILINLLSNAVKFTTNGSVSLCITLQQVDRSQARLLFCVKDTGIGIAVDDHNKLFKPFQQLDESITRRFGGTGLGLALSHNLLQFMDGVLSVISMPELGSNFSFELVLEVSPLPEQEKIQPPSATLGSVLNQVKQPLVGSRILVAEDNVFNQQIIREFLNLSGINVDIANDGQEALALLAISEFDAVLMDIHMPVMDGFEATRQIRRLSCFKTMPIIALTAGVTEEERGQCLAAGMNDFVSKPINPTLLLSALEQWIKHDNTSLTK